MNKFDLLDALLSNQAKAKIHLAKFPVGNDFFDGYLTAIQHAIDLAQLQKIATVAQATCNS